VGSQYLRKATISSVMSVRLHVRLLFHMEQLGSDWTDFNGNWHLSIFRKTVAKTRGSLKSHMKPNTYFLIISRSILLRMRTFSAKICTENQNTFFPTVKKKIVSYMRYSRKILQSRTGRRWQYGAFALHVGNLRLQTLAVYVVLIAFPLQERLHKRASMFPYTYITCLVFH
jgi:hypothetical protein